MILHSALMIALEQHIKTNAWSQVEAARLLGVTQPRVSDLMRGKIDLFSTDTPVNMLTAAGVALKCTSPAQPDNATYPGCATRSPGGSRRTISRPRAVQIPR
jgi:predicted XRE-type DNA-binding protein